AWRPRSAEEAVVESSRQRPGLEERALHRDLALAEREHIAAVDLDRAAVGTGSGEEPLRQTAVARHEVARGAEVSVGKRGEHARERRAHTLAPDVAPAAGLGPRHALEDALVGHERHQPIDVVSVPAGFEERVQIFRGHRVSPSSREGSPRSRLAVNSRYIQMPAARGAMYGVRACTIPIHPRGRVAGHRILRYPLIRPIEGPTVRVKGS